MQNYKIYLNERELLLSTQPLDGSFRTKQFLSYSESELSDFTSFLNNLPKAENLIYILVKSIEDALQKIFTQIALIRAAGGLIRSEQGNVLCIYRNDKWDLPKGKIDPGEDSQRAAWREVAEECGISSHVIESFFQSTFHLYILKKKWVLKQTDWYLMSAKEEELHPQLEEGITLAQWINPRNFSQVYANTYPLIHELLLAWNEKTHNL